MNVAILAAIAVPRDAISAAAVAHAELAASMPGVDRVDLFAEWIDRAVEVDSHVVAGPSQLLRHPRWRAADVVIVEWGIHCPTFDALTVTMADAVPTAVVFHNMTPAGLVPPNRRDQLERSASQLGHLVTLGPRWWTYSEENRRLLELLGVSDVRFVPFPITAPCGEPQRVHHGALRLLAVGRLDPAKGTDVLIESAGLLAHRLDFQLELVGNPAFSPPGFIELLRRRIKALGLESRVSISSDVDDEGLWRRLRRADVLVVPSRHEGLCVPVVQAYQAGCRVVAADGGNLRYLVRSPDLVVAAGDPDALAAGIQATAARDRSRPDDRPHAAPIVEAYSLDTARAALSGALAELSGDPRAGRGVWPAVLGPTASAATAGRH